MSAHRADPMEPLRFLISVAAYAGDECINWPYGTDRKGYGKATKDGRNVRANRFVCESRHGPAPTTEHHAAHSCGNKSCVNPRHLRWATPAENEADKLIHGTHNRGSRSGRSKLTEDDVRKIRALLPVQSRQEIAATFNVSVQTICAIHAGDSWAWLDSVSSHEVKSCLN